MPSSAVAGKDASQAANRSTVPEALEPLCRELGLDPAALRDVASLPPWPEEDAAAFERVINEAFEQVEEPCRPPA